MLLFLFIWERDKNRETETEYYSACSHPLVHFPNAGNRICWELKLQSGLPRGWEGPDYLSYYCCLPGKRFVFLAITSLGLSTMSPTCILRSGSTLYPHKNPTRKSHCNLQIRKRAQRSFFFFFTFLGFQSRQEGDTKVKSACDKTSVLSPLPGHLPLSRSSWGAGNHTLPTWLKCVCVTWKRLSSLPSLLGPAALTLISH